MYQYCFDYAGQDASKLVPGGDSPKSSHTNEAISDTKQMAVDVTSVDSPEKSPAPRENSLPVSFSQQRDNESSPKANIPKETVPRTPRRAFMQHGPPDQPPNTPLNQSKTSAFSAFMSPHKPAGKTSMRHWVFLRNSHRHTVN